MRGKALIAAVELVAPEGREAEFAAGALGTRMGKILTENGLLSRNILDAMALCPPLIISRGEIDEMVGILARSLDELAASL